MLFETSEIQITHEILALIAEIDEFKGAWRASETPAPKRLYALRHVALIESIGSSIRLEGSKITDRDVKRLLAKLNIESFASTGEQATAACAKVMETVFESWTEISFTEKHVQQLHRDLLSHGNEVPPHRAACQTRSTSVPALEVGAHPTGVGFDTSTPLDTRRRMHDLIAWLNETRAAARLHPLLTIGIFVGILLDVRPFQVGHERLSHILTTILLLQAGYAYVPYSSLGSVLEHRKDAYDLALRRTRDTLDSSEPNWQPWLLFFLQALQEQKRRLAVQVEHEKILVATMPELSGQIFDYTRQNGRATIRQMTRITGASRNTLKRHIRRLVAAGRLKQHGTLRGTWYSLS